MSGDLFNQQNKQVFTVSDINQKARGLLEDEIGPVWIEGELSGTKLHSSGHFYFTLKDDRSQIPGVMFRSDKNRCSLHPADGMKVRAYGHITLYEVQGRYQLRCTMLEDAGLGDLHKAFEALKKKLKEEGLFDQDRKKPIPRLPRHIGIVTSPSGAAIRDIINVLSRRFPNVHVVLHPVRVQGAGAAEEIAAAIHTFNLRADMDVLIVGRGGGSLEDLWCFNEEPVARAVAASTIPVISAVGHEIDFTICDFSADLRAPTPSAAAELVVEQKTTMEKAVTDARQSLQRALFDRIQQLRHRLNSAAESYVFREPANALIKYRQQLDYLYDKWSQTPQTVLRNHRDHLQQCSESLRSCLYSAWLNRQQYFHRLRERLQQRHPGTVIGVVRTRIRESDIRLRHLTELQTDRAKQRLQMLDRQLQALGPDSVLRRGFTVTRDQRGNILRSIHESETGDTVRTDFRDGFLISTVKEQQKR